MNDGLLSPAFLLAATEFARVWLLRDYNTRVVLGGTLLLGIGAGVVGTLMLLRKRALVADVASHAALPGICLAFLWGEAQQTGSGKALPRLLLGAALSAGAGLLTAQLLRKIRRVHDDAALGLTLSLYFGAGVVLLTWIQSLPTGQAAGLSEYVFGKASAMVAEDLHGLALVAFVAAVLVLALRKEFELLCFDPGYARAGGWPVGGLDLLLTILVIGLVVVGMQSVGLLLIVAMMVLPPTAARFWTNRFGEMIIISGGLGGLSAACGVMLSASFPNLATGAVIVLSGSACFAISLIFGRTGGLWWRWRQQTNSRQQIELSDLLRACYEVLEPELATNDELIERPLPLARLRETRNWSPANWNQRLRSASRAGWVRQDANDDWRLTTAGRRAAIEAVRHHRLWELYLIHFAEIAPHAVDRNADTLEHALGPEVIEQLELLLPAESERTRVPPSPHATLGATP